MSLKIIFREFNEDEDGLKFYVSDSPLDLEDMPSPLDETGPSDTLTDESEEHGDHAVSHTVPWDVTEQAYVKVVAQRNGSEVASQQWEYEPDEEGSGGSEDFSTAEIGDEIGGGIYSGIDTIDGVDYHIVAGKEESQEFGLQWKTSNSTTTETDSEEDGLGNTLAMEAAGLEDHPAAAHCLAYDGGGYSDWHMPARSQAELLYDNLQSHHEFSTMVSSSDFTWTSSERNSSRAWNRRFSDGSEGSSFSGNKDSTNRWVCPIRRVPV